RCRREREGRRRARDCQRGSVRRRVARSDHARGRCASGRPDGRCGLQGLRGRAVSFLSLTERDRDEMLAAIGVDSIEELFRDIPEGMRFDRELDLEPPLSEQEIVAHLEELAARNSDTGKELSFLGAGIYHHYVPAAVDAVLQRGELLTAYTPYQAEMSQGVL